ncbi:MAG: hypothetical protein QOI60_1579 [Actinomycetota bacterium]|nr:hypothetical protein [Actinomycetota bacterium]
MALKAIIAAALATATAFVASAGKGSAEPRQADPCVVASAPAITDVVAALYQGVPVARNGGLALAGGPDLRLPIPAGRGTVRHVASDPRFGVVYVLDLPGGDDIVAETPAGQVRLHRDAEVSHPAWMPGGDIVWGEGERLQFWSHRTGAISASMPPIHGGLVFSPVASSANSVVAVVAEPLHGVLPEDEHLSDLWHYDLRGKRWHRVTQFQATADRWSIIRTPELGPKGVEFIRVHGRASATREPTFERWALQAGRAHMETVLPGERYLAGYRDGHRLWNLPSDHPATWLLAQETRSGALRELGCGAVQVDPVDVPDPDRVAHATSSAPASDYPIPPPGDQPPAHEVAVLVGDYSGESGATNAAHQIIAEYGPDAQVKVVDSDAAPTALKPGSWGAIMWIGAQGDPVNAIKHFWDKLPQYADRSWVVAP